METTSALSFSFTSVTPSSIPVALEATSFDLSTSRINPDVCDISDAAFLPLSLPNAIYNVCGCSVYGQCDLVTETCTCSPGYSGLLCQYLSSEMPALTAKHASDILTFIAAYVSLSPLEALVQAGFLSSPYELISLTSAQHLISVTLSLASL